MLPRKLHNSRLPFICLTLTTIVYDTHWSRAVFLLIHTQSAWPGFLLCSRGAGRGPALLGVSCGADAGPCRLCVPRGSLSQVQEEGGEDAGGGTAGSPGPGVGLGQAQGRLPTARPLSLAEDPTFRCDACDELFPSKLDLRRHKKYACSSVGAVLYEGLADELKPEGLGGGGSDGQAHECKDCERMFPSKYRCRPHPALPAPLPGASQGQQGPLALGAQRKP